jgi:trehalose 6-phosphate synthase/phosphatase
MMQVFACTVGQKPSRAPFYVNDTLEVAALLSRLAGVEGDHPEVSDDISMQL